VYGLAVLEFRLTLSVAPIVSGILIILAGNVFYETGMPVGAKEVAAMFAGVAVGISRAFWERLHPMIGGIDFLEQSASLVREAAADGICARVTTRQWVGTLMLLIAFGLTWGTIVAAIEFRSGGIHAILANSWPELLEAPLFLRAGSVLAFFVACRFLWPVLYPILMMLAPQMVLLVLRDPRTHIDGTGVLRRFVTSGLAWTLTLAFARAVI